MYYANFILLLFVLMFKLLHRLICMITSVLVVSRKWITWPTILSPLKLFKKISLNWATSKETFVRMCLKWNTKNIFRKLFYIIFLKMAEKFILMKDRYSAVNRCFHRNSGACENNADTVEISPWRADSLLSTAYECPFHDLKAFWCLK